MPLTVRAWHPLPLVFQFNLNIKCFVLSLHSIIVSGRLQVTDVANKQFIALEYKYPLWHPYSPLVELPVIRRPLGMGRQLGWKTGRSWWKMWRMTIFFWGGTLVSVTPDNYSQMRSISSSVIILFLLTRTGFITLRPMHSSHYFWIPCQPWRINPSLFGVRRRYGSRRAAQQGCSDLNSKICVLLGRLSTLSYP